MIIPYLMMSYAQGWNPAFLTSPPKLWLDDQSPLTLVSGAVSAWGDRSGNGWNVSQATAANRPVVGAGLNGRRTILFDGVNDILDSGANGRNIFRNTTYGYMLTVVKKTAADGVPTNRAVCSVPRGGATPGVRAAQYLGITSMAVNTQAAGGRRLDGDAFGSASNGAAGAGTWYMRLDHYRWNDRQIDMHIDGQLSASGTGLWTAGGATSNTDSGAGIAVGASLTAATFSAEAWADVDLACVLMGNAAAALSTGEIDKLFGWAAWQYGLQASLPVGHPYKNSPP